MKESQCICRNFQINVFKNKFFEDVDMKRKKKINITLNYIYEI